ncbi:glycosyltransferase family 2 protein [Ruegeria sediminis]|uniref:Glycosyltransferase family 2 protein n=1 Tax=Ruegeria sediminis TaxID=2583820 RepID=A0ABY2X3V3_9RHOB|nr:glycosyltransferase family 2 protein [Ruegeria sediminis]TMV10038.1 glycosyltransferase family 2 protein [Ruegeria sediminis]
MRTNGTAGVGASVSIVVPCFNEEEVLPAASERLLGLADRAKGYEFEFIFVDDGSSDGTLGFLRRLADKDDRVRVLTFSRNFGHQIAVSAGIDAATGDCAVLIDADLQDPPEVVLRMLEKWREGFDVVYGVRESRPGETHFKRGSARIFYRLLNRLSDVPIPLDTGDFRLMSRPVVEVLKTMPEKHRFVRGMVAWAGFRQYALPYEREERRAGVSKYPLRKMIQFASDGIVSFSSKPLRLATNLGLLASGLAIVGIFYALAMRIFTSIWVEGWTALMIAVLFIGGVQLISLGVIGEYIGRVYEETKKRPLYIVRERIGFPDAAAEQDAAKTPAESGAG